MDELKLNKLYKDLLESMESYLAMVRMEEAKAEDEFTDLDALYKNIWSFLYENDAPKPVNDAFRQLYSIAYNNTLTVKINASIKVENEEKKIAKLKGEINEQ
jgi:hypothetical protein